MHLSRIILRPLTALFVGGAIALFSADAFAARITKTAKKSVMIENEDTEVQVDQKFFVIIDGKKKGLVQITKVSGGKSLGKITKGRAEVDATLEPVGKASAGGKKRRKKDGGDEGGGAREQALYIGALGGYSMNNQSVKGLSETVSMTGSSFSIKGFADYPLSESLGLIVRLGVDQFGVKGESKERGAVKTEIMYGSVDALLRYSFGSGSFSPFAAVGLGIWLPLSKQSDVLDVPRIATTNVILLDVGVNYFLSNRMMLTGLFEYDYFPPSNDVTTSAMTLRFGAGFQF